MSGTRSVQLVVMVLQLDFVSMLGRTKRSMVSEYADRFFQFSLYYHLHEDAACVDILEGTGS